MAGSPQKLTPTEEQILEVLSDGMFHTRDELLEVCNRNTLSPEPLSRTTMRVMVSRIRKKLPEDQAILNVNTGAGIALIHVILMAPVRSKLVPKHRRPAAEPIAKSVGTN